MKAIEIKRCADCPFNHEYGGNHCAIDHIQRPLEDCDISKTVPDWCPLMDEDHVFKFREA